METTIKDYTVKPCIEFNNTQGFIKEPLQQYTFGSNLVNMYAPKPKIKKPNITINLIKLDYFKKSKRNFWFLFTKIYE